MDWGDAMSRGAKQPRSEMTIDSVVLGALDDELLKTLRIASMAYEETYADDEKHQVAAFWAALRRVAVAEAERRRVGHPGAADQTQLGELGSELNEADLRHLMRFCNRRRNARSLSAAERGVWNELLFALRDRQREAHAAPRRLWEMLHHEPGDEGEAYWEGSFASPTREFYDAARSGQRVC